MFLPSEKAMRLRHDVCRWHVAELFLSLRSINRGPRGILCTRGEKAHTSKRVSIIACNNVISKVQCATHLPEGTQCEKANKNGRRVASVLCDIILICGCR